MIYNLYAYLLEKLPGLEFVVDGWGINDEESSTLVTQSGGTPQHWYPRSDYTAQIITRDESKFTCRKNSLSVYDIVKNKFNCILPEITLGGVVFPEITVAQMSPIQIPGYIGTDKNSRHLYSFNITLTVGG